MRAAGALAVLAALLGTIGIGTAEAQKSRPLCFGKPATIVGTQRTDGIFGTKGDDVIVGLGGHDSISGWSGNDLICGGPGNDELEGDAGLYGSHGKKDRADGGPGEDVCREAEFTVRCEETRPDLPREGDLEAGTWVSETFRPRVGFTLGRGWSVPFVTLPTQILLSQEEDPGGRNLRFDSIGRRSVAATIARFGRLQGVHASAPTPARVGSATGQSVDLHVGRAPVVVRGLTEAYELEPDDRVRAYAVNVEGTTVSIFVEAPAGKFAAFSAIATRVLASVRWG